MSTPSRVDEDKARDRLTVDSWVPPMFTGDIKQRRQKGTVNTGGKPILKTPGNEERVFRMGCCYSWS